jgi:hypothetical protein
MAAEIWMVLTRDMKEFRWCFAPFRRTSSMGSSGGNALCYIKLESSVPTSLTSYR